MRMVKKAKHETSLSGPSSFIDLGWVVNYAFDICVILYTQPPCSYMETIDEGYAHKCEDELEMKSNYVL